MAYYNLENQPVNAKADAKYCYLAIVKIDKQLPKRDKKYTKKERDDHNESYEKNQETIKKLSTKAHFNCFNSPIESMNIIEDSWSHTYFFNMEGYILYRIKPTSCKELTKGYNNEKYYSIYEFDVLNVMTTQEEVLKQLAEDLLLTKFYSYIVQKRCSTGDDNQTYSFAELFRKTFQDYTAGLNDLILSDNYDKSLKYNWNNVHKNTIPNLLEMGYIKYYSKNIYSDQIIPTLSALLQLGEFKIALDFVKELPNFISEDRIEIKDFSENVRFKTLLKLRLDDERVKQIAKILGIKLDILTLAVTREEYKEYSGSDYITLEETIFPNINEIKSHLIKKYDIPFDKLLGDISKLDFRPKYNGYDEYEDYEYHITVE